VMSGSTQSQTSSGDIPFKFKVLWF
jgi:hypothetical protein